MRGCKKYCFTKLICLLSGFMSFNCIISQELPKDCMNGLNVCKPVYRFDEIYLGEGKYRNEINSDLSCLKRGENNSLWFIIKVISDGELGFLITPDSLIDMDWSVYNLTNSPCSRISIDKSIEVSCNFSEMSAFPAEKGKTGPTGATANTQGDMNSSPYNKKIPVKAGQTYVIAVVTWWTLSVSGFTIDFGLSTANIYDDSSPYIASVSNDACGGSELRLKFSKYINCNSIASTDFTVEGPGGPYQVSEIISGNCSKTNFGSDDEFILKFKDSIFGKGNYKLVTTGSYTDICGNGNALPEEVPFTVNEMPVVITADKTEVCIGEKVQLLSNVDGKPPFNYEWFPAQFLSCSDCPGPKATIYEKTVFKVKVYDATDCAAEDSITIDVLPSPSINIIHGDTSLCESGSANLEAAITGITNPVIIWTPSTGLNSADILNPVASPPETTEYTVRITDPATGCSSEKKITVMIGKPIQPILKLSGKTGNAEICAGENYTLDAGASDEANNEEYSKYSWFRDGMPVPDSSRQFLIINQPGKYSVDIISKGGCKGSSEIEVTAIPFPETEIQFPQSVCTGGEFKLAAQINGNKDNFDIKWLVTDGFTGPDNDWEPSILLNNTGSYRYISEITDKITLCRSYDTVTVDVIPGITLELGNDIEACPGEKISLKAFVSGGGSGYKYKWAPVGSITIPNPKDSSVAEIVAYESLKVLAEAGNNGGCSSVDSLTVNITVPVSELSLPIREFGPRQRDVIIPVSFVAESGLLRCKPRFAILKLEWNFSVFNPRKAFAGGREINLQRDYRQNTRTWEITVEIPDSLITSPGETLVEILGDAMLGETDTAALKFKSVQWDDFSVINKMNNGFLRINDICTIGGKRLIDYRGAFYISSVSPIPADNSLNIELKSNVKQEYYQIRIFNFFGNIIDEISILKPGETEIKRIFTGEYSPGIYRIVVTGNVYSVSEDILIVR